MRVIYHNRTRLPEADERRLGAAWVERDALLAQADFVVVMAPYSPATHHLIGAAEIAKMKPTAILVNSARGGVVDDAALVEALQGEAHRRRGPRRLRGRADAERRATWACRTSC